MALNSVLNVLKSFFERKPTGRDSESGEIADVLIDTSEEMLFISDLRNNESEPLYGENADKITAACNSMKLCSTKHELMGVLGSEIMQFSLKDLEQMNLNFELKLKHISDSYKKKLLPKVHEQIFDAHHRLVSLYRQGKTGKGDDDEPLSPDFYRFCDMVSEACRVKAYEKDPKILYLKYLLATFTMFIMDEPAHPVGTPFPGGQIVDKWDGVYYCPVRDMADDVAFSLCPFCPAVQSDEPVYPWSAKIRRKKEKQECLENYWTNYKG